MNGEDSLDGLCVCVDPALQRLQSCSFHAVIWRLDIKLMIRNQIWLWWEQQEYKRGNSEGGILCWIPLAGRHHTVNQPDWCSSELYKLIIFQHDRYDYTKETHSEPTDSQVTDTQIAQNKEQKPKTHLNWHQIAQLTCSLRPCSHQVLKCIWDYADIPAQR